jgi:3-dehydroquinate dehydratase
MSKVDKSRPTRADDKALQVRLSAEDMLAISTIRHAIDSLINPGAVSTASDAIRFALASCSRLCQEQMQQATFVPAEPGEDGNP